MKSHRSLCSYQDSESVNYKMCTLYKSSLEFILYNKHVSLKTLGWRNLVRHAVLNKSGNTSLVRKGAFSIVSKTRTPQYITRRFDRCCFLPQVNSSIGNFALYIAVYLFLRIWKKSFLYYWRVTGCSIVDK